MTKNTKATQHAYYLDRLGLWSQLIGLFILSIALFLCFATYNVFIDDPLIIMLSYSYAFINAIAGLLFILCGTYVGAVKGKRTRLAAYTIIGISVLYVLNFVTLVTMYYGYKVLQTAPQKPKLKTTYTVKKYLLIPTNSIAIGMFILMIGLFIATIPRVV